jgi:hypothetical protein
MHVGVRTAAGVADSVCPLSRTPLGGKSSRACWSLLAVRYGIVKSLTGDAASPQELAEALRVSMGALRTAARDWGALDWSTRYGWMKLANAALLDASAAACDDPACDAAAAGMPSNRGCADPACGSATSSPMPGSGHGGGSPRSGGAATPKSRR